MTWLVFVLLCSVEKLREIFTISSDNEKDRRCIFYAAHLLQGHMQCLSRRHKIDGKGNEGVSAMLLVTTVQYVFIIILVSLLKSVPAFCRYCARYKYL